MVESVPVLLLAVINAFLFRVSIRLLLPIDTLTVIFKEEEEKKTDRV